jgi:hypothetical protein
MGYATKGDFEKLAAIVRQLAADLATTRAAVETVRALERGLAAKLATFEKLLAPQQEGKIHG